MEFKLRLYNNTCDLIRTLRVVRNMALQCYASYGVNSSRIHKVSVKKMRFEAAYALHIDT